MLKSVSIAAARTRPNTLVLGHFAGKGLCKACTHHDVDSSIACALARPEATGDLGAITEAFPADGFERVLIVGLGEPKKLTNGHFRTVAAAVGRRLAQIKVEAATVCFAGPLEDAANDNLDANGAGIAFGESIGLLTFDAQRYKGSTRSTTKRNPLALKPSDHAGTTDFADGLDYGLGLAESTNIGREIAYMPPNELYPTSLASIAQKMARDTGLKCTIFKGKDLDKHQLVGLKTVGQASEHEPCLIRLEYTPPSGGRSSKPVVLVGKTITYDCGGLSIKVGGGMRGMKYDMGGGAAVFGAMHAVATVIQPRKRVVAYLCAAENAISDEAYRPDDIITYANGVTVEVTNTDAEGRLVLADGLAYACKHDKPAAILDIATLTGGVVVALGDVYAGLWCNHDELRDTVERAGERSGDRVWRLPLNQDYRDMMKSQVADILNSTAERAAHPIQGAAFLSYFVDENVPWAHIDIAGHASSRTDSGPIQAATPTGFGVKLLADVCETL